MEMQSATVGKIAEALCAAQAELPAAIKGSVNPHLKNRYADLNAIYEAARATLAKHDLAVVQTMQPTDGKAHVRTTLLHKSGEWIAGELVMPLDRNGGPQGMGSAITYARRYSLSAIIGIVTEEDDDAEAAQGRGKPAQAKVKAQRQEAAASNADPMTEQQRKKLFSTVKQVMPEASREDVLMELSDIVERHIESSNALTKSEAALVIDALEARLQPHAIDDPFALTQGDMQ